MYNGTLLLLHIQWISKHSALDRLDAVCVHVCVHVVQNLPPVQNYVWTQLGFAADKGWTQSRNARNRQRLDSQRRI